MTVNPIDCAPLPAEVSYSHDREFEMFSGLFKLRVGQVPKNLDGDLLRQMTTKLNNSGRYEFRGGTSLGGTFNLSFTHQNEKSNHKTVMDIVVRNGAVDMKNIQHFDPQGNLVEESRVAVSRLPDSGEINSLQVWEKNAAGVVTYYKKLSLVNTPVGQQAIMFNEVSHELVDQGLLQGASIVIPLSLIQSTPDLERGLHTLGANVLMQYFTERNIVLDINPANCLPITK